ncbi:hypothetical protein PIROE2DRAFT_11992 [Piromyces sp. E2]|nr:hypothetical protein PIROE2DRAFT_11992 [Piromyces sp. E2]|eukprot:OUM61880.1 hypothetical protein PIROE2DRAFT_11992 [Piromyces sp. E2]
MNNSLTVEDKFQFPNMNGKTTQCVEKTHSTVLLGIDAMTVQESVLIHNQRD